MRHLGTLFFQAGNSLLIFAFCSAGWAQTNDPATDQLKAQKDLAELQKAVAEAQKAQSEAELAAAKAKFGDLKDSGIGGTADLTNANAGSAEGLLLGSKAVNQIADKFVVLIGAATGQKTLVLVTTETVPDFQQWIAFESQYTALKTAVTQAEKATGEPRTVTESVATVAAALPFVSSLLSYAKTDYKFIGIEVESTDAMLLRAMAGRLKTNGWSVTIPSVYLPQASAASNDVLSKFGDLDAWSIKAKDRLGRFGADKKLVESELAKKPNDPQKQKLEGDLKMSQSHLASWQAVSDAVDAASKRLTTADDKGSTAIAAIVRQGAIKKLLTDGAGLLVVQLHKVAASGYSKKNLWSSLGANPFYVMGGAVASYVLVNGKDGAVMGAELLPLSGGYHSVSKLEEKVNEPPKPPESLKTTEPAK